MQSPYLLSFHPSSSIVLRIWWHICLSHGLYRQELLPYLLSFRRKGGQIYPAWFANRKYWSHLLDPTLVPVCAFYLRWALHLLPPYSRPSLHYQKRQLILSPVVMGPQQITWVMFKKYKAKQTHVSLQRWAIAFVKQQKGASREVKANVHFHSEV